MGSTIGHSPKWSDEKINVRAYKRALACLFSVEMIRI